MEWVRIVLKQTLAGQSQNAQLSQGLPSGVKCMCFCVVYSSVTAIKHQTKAYGSRGLVAGVGSRDSKLEMTHLLSKPIPNNVPLPTRAYHPTFPKQHLQLVQMPETLGAIGHSNHHKLPCWKVCRVSKTPQHRR